MAFASGDVCACGHAGSYHDATSGLCRFASSPSPMVNCGCEGFVAPGAATYATAPTNDAGLPLPGEQNVIGNDDR